MATGTPVGHLLELDEEMLATLNDVYAEQWTRQEQLLALIVDLLGEVRHAVLVAPHVQAKDVKKMQPPVPLDRPGQRRKRRGSTLSELAALGATQFVGR